MKKIYVYMILIFLILSLVTPVSANPAEPTLVIELLAGKNQHAGVVKVWDDSTSLYILYETVTPWCLMETHLAVSSSLADIPQKNGNPIPGQFPYKNTHNCVNSFLYTIPLNSGACELYIAAHAVVKKPGLTETAWGNGLDFSGDNWGTYFTYESNNCTVTPPPTGTSTPPTGTATPPTETGTPPTGTATPPTGTATPPTETGTPPTGTATPPTGTATPPTETGTPQVCQPTVIAGDFSRVALGQSVEGLGVVAPGLNIDAKGTAIKIIAGSQPGAYGAGNGNTVLNGGISANGGFTDKTTQMAQQSHLYTFTFAPGTSASNFSLHMLDFGDLNPLMATATYASMTAYNANGFIIAKQELSYTTTAPNSYISPQYGNLLATGDAIQALPGQPGNWIWNVSGSGIVKVVLEFGSGFDPNIAFDSINFTTACP